jgi:hypothetical protein
MSDIWLLAAHVAAHAQILLLVRLNCLSLEEEVCQRKMASVNQAEVEEGLHRTRASQSYLVPVENVSDALEKDPFKVRSLLYINCLMIYLYRTHQTKGWMKTRII